MKIGSPLSILVVALAVTVTLLGQSVTAYANPAQLSGRCLAPQAKAFEKLLADAIRRDLSAKSLKPISIAVRVNAKTTRAAFSISGLGAVTSSTAGYSFATTGPLTATCQIETAVTIKVVSEDPEKRRTTTSNSQTVMLAGVMG